MDKYKNKPVIVKKTTAAANDSESNENQEWESKLDSEIELNDKLETPQVNLCRIEDPLATRGFFKSIEAEFRTDIAQALAEEEYWD